MRIFVKKQILELLDKMMEQQKEITSAKSFQEKQQFCSDCQQTAIIVGNTIEQEIPKDTLTVAKLEDYCEKIFLLTQEELISEDRISELDEIIAEVCTAVKNIPVTYHVLFLPYKAEMWDSLESIWRACREDARCECVVMPIPYFQFNGEKREWEYCYEGENFPEDVRVIHYENYALEKLKPDAAYIHNPYDDQNYVTSVHPAFYSEELKKNVRKLVYVPYYVTSGFMSPEHLMFPVYKNMDYMVIQSEYAKQSCQGMYYYDKLLPLGSPKLDRVIQLGKKERMIPEEWKKVLENKKTMMLNTSINCLLRDGETYFKKIIYLCEVIRKQEQAALIWRPHPLLKATMKSMRPHLLPKCLELEQYFIESGVGVIDDTPDITRTVVLADAYIGEEETSVINLFGAAGKPIFILNNLICDEFTEEEQRRIHIFDLAVQNDRLWFTTNQLNALFFGEPEGKELHLAGRVEGQPKWDGAYPFLAQKEGRLFLSPYMASVPAAFDTRKKEFVSLLSGRPDFNLQCRRVVIFGNQVFYLPTFFNSIIEIDTDTNEIEYHTACIQELQSNRDTAEEVTFQCQKLGEALWITATYTNRVLEFHMREGSYILHDIGRQENGYSGIVLDGRYVWLAEVHSGEIIRWDRSTREVRSYQMPDGFKTWKSAFGRCLAHLNLVQTGKWIVTIPGFSNTMIKLDKETGETVPILRDFWQAAEQPCNGYSPELRSSSEFGEKLNETSVMVQRFWDDALAVVNVEDESYETFYPILEEEGFAALTEGEDGFEKREEKYGFFRRESRYFPFKGFLDDLVSGQLDKVKQRQLRELSTLAANLDGICGEKVHQYVMQELQAQE